MLQTFSHKVRRHSLSKAHWTIFSSFSRLVISGSIQLVCRGFARTPELSITPFYSWSDMFPACLKLPLCLHRFTVAGGVFSLWIYAVPVSATCTRLIINAGGNFPKPPPLQLSLTNPAALLEKLDPKPLLLQLVKRIGYVRRLCHVGFCHTLIVCLILRPAYALVPSQQRSAWTRIFDLRGLPCVCLQERKLCCSPETNQHLHVAHFRQLGCSHCAVLSLVEEV